MHECILHIKRVSIKLGIMIDLSQNGPQSDDLGRYLVCPYKSRRIRMLFDFGQVKRPVSDR